MRKVIQFDYYYEAYSEYGKDYFWSQKDKNAVTSYYFKIDGVLIEVSYEIYMLCMKSAKKLEYAEMVQVKRKYRSLDNKEDFVELELHRADENEIAESIYKNELYKQLHAAIRNLDTLERMIIYGTYFEELSERQLAAKLDIPQRTINYKKHQILNCLKKSLLDKGADEYICEGDGGKTNGK